MSRHVRRAVFAALAVAMSVAPIDTTVAQDVDTFVAPQPHYAMPWEQPGEVAPPDLQGLTGTGSKWIAATKFLPVNPAAPALAYESFAFFRSPGSATPQPYIAHVDDVPNGALLTGATCVYRDTSVTNNVTFFVGRGTQSFAPGQKTGGGRGTVILASFTSSGTPDVSYETFSLTTPETLRVVPSPNSFTQYLLQAEIADDTSFAGCLVNYSLQLSPSPATASFTDVPTTHPFFQVIEALKASGITGGCTASQYCPDAPVTRAAMAAFLARALGLFFPN